MGRYDNGKGKAVAGIVLWAASVATASLAIYKDYVKVKHNKVIEKLEKGIFNYLDRKEKENKISRDEYLSIISLIKDNMEEVLKLGYEDFIDKQILHIIASKEIHTATE